MRLTKDGMDFFGVRSDEIKRTWSAVGNGWYVSINDNGVFRNICNSALELKCFIDAGLITTYPVRAQKRHD